MAIKRCPYCKAIIDDEAQYCANCGTQLLFPEDEEIEEGIPGERIVEEEPEEENEREEEEVVEPPAEEEVEWKKSLTPEEELHKKEGEESPEQEDELEMLVGKRGEEPIEEERVHEEAGEAAGEVFGTADLDKIEDVAEIGEEEVEEIISGLREEEKDEAEKEAMIPEAEEDLPPWAEKFREVSTPEAPSHSEMKEEEESGEEAEQVFPVYEEEVMEKGEAEEPVVDSGVGLPEQEPQKDLPFEDEGEEDYEEEVSDSREFPRPSLWFSMKLKARAFDLCFIAVLWAITVWYASRLMAVSPFKLISVSASAIFGFLIILLLLYFFLFLFFLGRTLGDRIFIREA